MNELNGDQHVIPEFGREHEASRTCWCKPKIESVYTTGTIWLHEPTEEDPTMPGTPSAKAERS